MQVIKTTVSSAAPTTPQHRKLPRSMRMTFDTESRALNKFPISSRAFYPPHSSKRRSASRNRPAPCDGSSSVRKMVSSKRQHSQAELPPKLPSNLLCSSSGTYDENLKHSKLAWVTWWLATTFTGKTTRRAWPSHGQDVSPQADKISSPPTGISAGLKSRNAGYSRGLPNIDVQPALTRAENGQVQYSPESSGSTVTYKSDVKRTVTATTSPIYEACGANTARGCSADLLFSDLTDPLASDETSSDTEGVNEVPAASQAHQMCDNTTCIFCDDLLGQPSSTTLSSHQHVSVTHTSHKNSTRALCEIITFILGKDENRTNNSWTKKSDISQPCSAEDSPENAHEAGERQVAGLSGELSEDQTMPKADRQASLNPSSQLTYQTEGNACSPSGDQNGTGPPVNNHYNKRAASATAAEEDCRVRNDLLSSKQHGKRTVEHKERRPERLWTVVQKKHRQSFMPMGDETRPYPRHFKQRDTQSVGIWRSNTNINRVGKSLSSQVERDGSAPAVNSESTATPTNSYFYKLVGKKLKTHTSSSVSLLTDLSPHTDAKSVNVQGCVGNRDDKRQHTLPKDSPNLQQPCEDGSLDDDFRNHLGSLPASPSKNHGKQHNVAQGILQECLACCSPLDQNATTQPMKPASNTSAEPHEYCVTTAEDNYGQKLGKDNVGDHSVNHLKHVSKTKDYDSLKSFSSPHRDVPKKSNSQKSQTCHGASTAETCKDFSEKNGNYKECGLPLREWRTQSASSISDSGKATNTGQATAEYGWASEKTEQDCLSPSKPKRKRRWPIICTRSDLILNKQMNHRRRPRARRSPQWKIINPSFTTSSTNILILMPESPDYSKEPRRQCKSGHRTSQDVCSPEVSKETPINFTEVSKTDKPSTRNAYPLSPSSKANKNFETRKRSHGRKKRSKKNNSTSGKSISQIAPEASKSKLADKQSTLQCTTSASECKQWYAPLPQSVKDRHKIRKAPVYPRPRPNALRANRSPQTSSASSMDIARSDKNVSNRYSGSSGVEIEQECLRKRAYEAYSLLHSETASNQKPQSSEKMHVSKQKPPNSEKKHEHPNKPVASKQRSPVGICPSEENTCHSYVPYHLSSKRHTVKSISEDNSQAPEVTIKKSCPKHKCKSQEQTCTKTISPPSYDNIDHQHSQLPTGCKRTTVQEHGKPHLYYHTHSRSQKPTSVPSLPPLNVKTSGSYTNHTQNKAEATHRHGNAGQSHGEPRTSLAQNNLLQPPTSTRNQPCGSSQLAGQAPAQAAVKPCGNDKTSTNLSCTSSAPGDRHPKYQSTKQKMQGVNSNIKPPSALQSEDKNSTSKRQGKKQSRENLKMTHTEQSNPGEKLHSQGSRKGQQSPRLIDRKDQNSQSRTKITSQLPPTHPVIRHSHSHVQQTPKTYQKGMLEEWARCLSNINSMRYEDAPDSENVDHCKDNNAKSGHTPELPKEEITGYTPQLPKEEIKHNLGGEKHKHGGNTKQKTGPKDVLSSTKTHSSYSQQAAPVSKKRHCQVIRFASEEDKASGHFLTLLLSETMKHRRPSHTTKNTKSRQTGQ